MIRSLQDRCLDRAGETATGKETETVRVRVQERELVPEQVLALARGSARASVQGITQLRERRGLRQ